MEPQQGRQQIEDRARSLNLEGRVPDGLSRYSLARERIKFMPNPVGPRR
jgi:hypothetical protein